MSQLSNTVNQNLMSSVNEISEHDVETIEGSLNDTYSRLESVAERMTVYDVQTTEEAQEQLNLESAASSIFNAIYLMDSEGNLFGSSYLHMDADEHVYDELFNDGRKRFVMRYDQENGVLETNKESLIFGVRMPDLNIGDKTFIALLGRSDLSMISDQLLVESFNGQGISSVVNARGYYIVSESQTTDVDMASNFYDYLEEGSIGDGVTVADVRQNIAEGKSFAINCVTAEGESMVLSFAPVAGTEWSFVMSVPASVFDARFAPFVTMTVWMLVFIVFGLVVLTFVIYFLMRRTVTANAQAKARSELLSNMSHEIRTPLNGIIGLGHLMSTHLDDRKAMGEYVNKLGKVANYLLSLVNDILDMSKLQAGKVELVQAPFNLKDLLNNVCEMQHDQLKERGINFEFNDQAVTHPYLIGDEIRISQIIMNILSNAVKFTPADGYVSLSAEQQIIGYGEIANTVIRVSDTGCGMSPEFCEHIFESFSQERNSNSESQKGTGLGMAISHLLSSVMGGTIDIESELEKGSVFTVTLPLKIDNAAGRRKESLEKTTCAEKLIMDSNIENQIGKLPGDFSNRSRHILVAEDNDLNADILESILVQEGYEITIANNGLEAVKAFSESDEFEFMAIFMDMQMPKMDGYDAAKEIRKLDRADAKSVRIFACTASTFADDRKLALKSGMDDFLAKPLNVPDMLNKLKALEENLGIRNENKEGDDVDRT